ncbi:MAG: hypothetical protein R3E01_00150 [Pirellulaceae bacterium]|nr:hypothetical protein [Planctomycetales bacterium]
MRLRFMLCLATLLVLPLLFASGVGEARAAIQWVGGTSSDVFDEGNWDLSGSGVVAIDPDMTIADDVLIGAGPFANNPEIPNEGGQVRFQLADGNTLTIDGGTLSYVAGGNDGVGGEATADADISNDGINGPIVNVINGGHFQPFFVTNDVRVNVDGTSSLTFGGGGNPVNNSSVNLQPGATMTFLAETPEAFNTEHLAKILIAGAPAVQDLNFTLAPLDATGSVITAIVPEPSVLALLLPALIAMVGRRKAVK